MIIDMRDLRVGIWQGIARNIPAQFPGNNPAAEIVVVALRNPVDVQNVDHATLVHDKGRYQALLVMRRKTHRSRS